MSWPCIFTSLVLALLAAPPASAQSLERAIMPGPLSEAHAKLEGECGNCHVRFNRAAQSPLCLNCHKEVASDVREARGYHGRLSERECKACHSEHKGREYRIVRLDEARFDHRQTDFPLKGKHTAVKCASCHASGTKQRNAPAACASCHRKNDPHKGSLGEKCETCHAETGWKPARFDHAKTRFPLRHHHAELECGSCHAGQRFAGTPRDCGACHKKDDAHNGRFGARCASCHVDEAWKASTFSHDRDTKFPLRERHRTVKCDACHRAEAVKPASACAGCHAKDDAHQGKLGRKCDACHAERGWKQPARFNHDRNTSFPLRGEHREVRCDACHRDAQFRQLPGTACVACHSKDDAERGHKGRFGERCETCHQERGFKATTFDHARATRYPLRGRHAQLACSSCHRGALYQDKLEAQCVFCHAAGDPHKGQLGKDCAGCHNETSWHEARFEHSRSAFPLVGRHAQVACKDCHATPAFRDAKVECVSCHARNDYHKQRLGSDCARCHNPGGWKDWRFDHAATSFPLVAKHATLRCTECHSKPVATRIDLPVACYGCHQHDDIHFQTNGVQCETCHIPENWRKTINRKTGG